MRRKFVRHYRRMLPLVLDILHFRSDNRFQPDGSVGKVILKQTDPRDWSEVCLCGGGLPAYAVDMGSCARYNDDING
jgi:hypothetical protein